MRRPSFGQQVRGGALAAVMALAAACGGSAKPAKDHPAQHDAAHSMRMADSLFRGGRVSEALATLREAIERFPDDATLHHTYGSYCLRAARLDEAEVAFRRALEIDPYLTDAHNMLGVVYLQRKDYGHAEREFEQALADPAYPTPQLTYLNLGLLYDEQGRHTEALTAIRRSVGIDPKFFKAHFHLASLLDRVGELVEAAREYEVAEPGFRSDGEYWYRRGLTYYRLGEADKARDCLLRVRAIAPGSESAARADEILDVLD